MDLTSPEPPEASRPAIVAVIPTFNEPDLLARCVASLRQQNGLMIDVIVPNAGDPLPPTLASEVCEVKLASSDFFTAQLRAGLDQARQGEWEFMLLANADTEFFPNTVARLLAFTEADNKVVACSPAYQKVGDGPISLRYSDQDEMGFLLYGRMMQRWAEPKDAPHEPYEIDLTGAQGVLFHRSLLEVAEVDVARFPQYASDHDFWLQARRAGFHLILDPQAGIVNLRQLSASPANGLTQRLKVLWGRMTSDRSPESIRVMWRLRAKHLPVPTAVVSTLASFVLRWTVGLKKIIQRT